MSQRQRASRCVKTPELHSRFNCDSRYPTEILQRRLLNPACLILQFAIIFSLVFSFSIPAFARQEGVPVSQSHPTYKTAIIDNFAPYVFVNAKREPDGFGVDVMKAVAQVMEINLEIKVMSWEEARMGLVNGDLDFLAMMAYSDERAKTFDFSPPYLIVYDAFFTRKDSAAVNSINDLQGKTIIAMKNDRANEYLLSLAFIRNENLILVGNYPDALRLLASGTGDAVLMPKLAGLGLVRELKLTNLETSPAVVEDYNRSYSFTVKKGNQAVLERLSQGMSIVKATGQYDEIYAKWFGMVDPSGISKQQLFQNLGIAGLIILAIGAVLLLWTFSLKRQVAARTRLLELEVQERKQAEIALKESEASFRAIFEKSATGYVLTSTEGQLIRVNAALAEMLGYTIDELQCVNFRDITHPEDQAISAESARSLLAAECESSQFEKRYLHRDGSIIMAFVNITLSRDSQNVPQYFITSVIDISARKKAEDALRESEFFFKESQRAGFIGSYKTDFPADHWDSSEVLDQIFGIEPDYDRSVKGWLGLIHPEDLARMNSYLVEEVITKRRPFNQNYRIIRKSDGETRWVHGAGVAGFDNDGNILTLIGTIQDITERKLAQDALQEKAEVLERFNTLMVNRELRMIELKSEINTLCSQLGQPPRYVLEFDETDRSN